MIGGDIMIHGAQVSDGCPAIGDQVAEDLFILAAGTGWPT
jgi:murein L,D-transpeptidase YafK